MGLQGSELHQMLVDKLVSRGGEASSVVLPGALIHPPQPKWNEALCLYKWLGWSKGETQKLIRSLHDVSDGGVLVALAECLVARNLGAVIEIPMDQDPWCFGFGEGFHSFVASLPETDLEEIEAEFKRYHVPALRLGRVISEPVLKVVHKKECFNVEVSALEKAWNKKGYWE